MHCVLIRCKKVCSVQFQKQTHANICRAFVSIGEGMIGRNSKGRHRGDSRQRSIHVKKAVLRRIQCRNQQRFVTYSVYAAVPLDLVGMNGFGNFRQYPLRLGRYAGYC